MPHPPPPLLAFISKGKPIFSASAPACSTFSTLSLPGITGMPAARMVRRAMSLSPMRASTPDGGPMKTILHSSHRAANFAFSERNPYPGWMAPAPVASAAEMIAVMFR